MRKLAPLFVVALFVSTVLVASAPQSNAATRTTTPKPVTITNLSETCQYGWAWTTVTVNVAKPGLYDVYLRDDYGTRLNDDGVQIYATGSFDLSLPNPEQVDVYLTTAGVTLKLAEKATPSVPCTHPGW